jgi:hypothetical protein
MQEVETESKQDLITPQYWGGLINNL